MQWQEYTIGFQYCRTRGTAAGNQEYLESVENSHRLIKELDRQGGIDLLLFCVRAGRVTATLQSSYRLFYEFLCEKKVPIVLAVTNLGREHRLEDWWVRNCSTFEKYQIQLAGHACITVNRLDGGYKESRITIWNLVQRFTADGQKPKELLAGGPFVKRKDLVSLLTKRCGVSPDVAKQLADMIRQDVG
ncbi:hypothetical protein DFJ58DRAFT_814934 [Suillus subalutaceus]|uniref:uncharacterized protein n=1 Tax=Suillus subalutaceus TaxID=48586 RepID=UPI001B86D4BB|nr:uncharacterized protein DFJ58DRAFT_814934 [Suillus subalutaceus]KAG1837922.1 hypothetical protein DFJ58DRAFT_814934 [Suillus subalutaceus]